MPSNPPEASALDPSVLLAIDVIRRAVAGEQVERRQMVLRDYDPAPHCCHDNVRAWVELHPEFKQVFGFFVANQQEDDTSIVIAHSAVADTDGTLCDITPGESRYRYPFVRHVGTEAEFDLIAAKEPFWLEIPNDLLRELRVI
jgi:hypothetical protein